MRVIEHKPMDVKIAEGIKLTGMGKTEGRKMDNDTIVFGTCKECGKAGAVFEKGCEHCNAVKQEIIKYGRSSDGKGLLAYRQDMSFYHIHSNELTQLEKWILALLHSNFRE